jgi:hypothetical protein
MEQDLETQEFLQVSPNLAIPMGEEDTKNSDLLIRKRALICEELAKIQKLMIQYKKTAKQLKFWDSFSKLFVTGASACASVALFVGIEQRVNNPHVSPLIYYIATASTCTATIFGQLINSWNLAEHAHSNHTTSKILHNLHDFVSYQLVRNHITSLQLDELLSDMNTRLILIRETTENL